MNLGFCFFTYLIIFIVFRNFWILHRIGCAFCLLLLEVVEFHSHSCFQHLAFSSVPWSLSSVLSYDDLFLSWFLVSNSAGFIIISGLSQEARSLYPSTLSGLGPPPSPERWVAEEVPLVSQQSLHAGSPEAHACLVLESAKDLRTVSVHICGFSLIYNSSGKPEPCLSLPAVQ